MLFLSSIKLTLNNITDTENWQGAKLYQYACYDQDLRSGDCVAYRWKPISPVAIITGESIEINAQTVDPRLGLFAILGDK